MIRTPHAAFLPRAGLLVCPPALVFVPARLRPHIVPRLQRCDRVEVGYDVFRGSTTLFISLKTGRVGAGAVEGIAYSGPTVSPDATDFARVPLGLIVRLQRRWRRALRLRAERRREVVAQALHPRLGAASPLASLTLDALRLLAARI